MYYRDGQPVAGSQTKMGQGKWHILVGYRMPKDSGLKPVNIQAGPYDTSEEADVLMDWFGAG